MQTVALKPKRAEWRAMTAGLILLCCAMFAVPALCLPLAVAAPLLACPLVGRKEEPLAWLSAVVPLAASAVNGYDLLYSVSLALVGLVPLLITRFIPMQKRPGPKGMLLYISAYACTLGIALAMATLALGGALRITLAEAFVNMVAASDRQEQILQQFAIRGLITIPKGYQVNGNRLAQAANLKQMMMSLRLTAEALIAQKLPSLYVQACMVTGLFTSLRLERVNGVLLVVEAKTAANKQTRVVAPPSFRLLTLPANMRKLWVLLAVTGILLVGLRSDVAVITGQLCYALVQTVACLLGAAVVVFLYTRLGPERRVFGGAVAVMLYLLAPGLLAIVGIADQFLHFRITQARKPDRT